MKAVLKPTWLSLILVVGLLALWFGIKDKRPTIEKVDNFFTTDINSFCVNNWCFEKNDNGWWFAGLPADNEKVERFVGEMESIKLDNLVSENQDSFAGMGFDNKSVVVKAGERQLIVGDLSSDYQSTLVKNNDKVYKVGVVWNELNLINQKYWERLMVTNLPIYQVKKMIVGGKEVNNKEQINWAAHLQTTGFAGKDLGVKGGTIISLETEQEKVDLTVGQGWVGKKYLYWATTDGKNYYEILKDDFYLLTARKN